MPCAGIICNQEELEALCGGFYIELYEYEVIYLPGPHKSFVEPSIHPLPALNRASERWFSAARKRAWTLGRSLFIVAELNRPT